MTTYVELKQQAEELLRQAEELRSEERSAVISQLRQTISDWNISLAELNFKEPKRAVRKVTAKYQDPASGKTWSGRGMHPKWMSEALANGYTKEQFLIAA